MRDLATLLRYEASRRPEIAALVERVGSMSIAEIETAKVPLPWYRKALLEMRNRLRGAYLADNYTTHGFVADTEGEMREWTGGNCYLLIDRNNQFEVLSGDLLWLPLTGGVWIGSVFSKGIDPRVVPFSSSRGIVMRTAYQIARRAKENGNAPLDAPVLFTDTGRSPAGGLASHGVRFF